MPAAPALIRRAALFLAALVMALGALGAVAPAHAQDMPPRPDGPVYDGADILSAATKAQLDQELRAYNRDTG